MIRAAAAPGPLEVSIFVEGLRARAAFFLGFSLVVFAVLWTLTAWIVDPTPHPKLALALAQGREWQLGYWGNPPLAPWLAEIAYRLGGLVAVYSLGPISIALAGWLVFLFARGVVGDRHGALAVFLMVGVHPVAFPVGAFDSDLVQMPLVALAVYLWWRAVHGGSRPAWIALGVALAAIAYAGITGLIVAAVLMLITAATGAGRSIFRVNETRIAAVAGLFVFTLLITPRLIWLQHQEFSGFVPALDGLIDPAATSDALGIAATVLAGHVGLLLLLAIASPLRAPDRETAPVFMRPPLDSFGRTSVLALALLPLPLALAAAVSTGNRFPVAAAAPLVLYSGLLVVVLANEALRIHRQRVVALAALTLLFLPPTLEVGGALAAPYVSDAGRATNWPAAAAARFMTEVYRTRTGRPLEIVAGDAQTASMIALASHDRPRVFIDADPARSPWLSEADIAARGAVVVWPVSGADTSPPAGLAERMPALVAEATIALPWVRPGRLDRVRIGWAIVPPAP